MTCTALFLCALAACALVAVGGAHAQNNFGDRFIRVTFDHCIVVAGAGGNPDAEPVCGFAAAEGYTVAVFPQTFELYTRLAQAVGDELARPAAPPAQPPNTGPPL